MVGDKVKELRTKAGISQAELARRLGIARSNINAWEMGLSSPNAACLIDLAKIFHCSTDYLLGLEKDNQISLTGLSKEETKVIYDLIDCFHKKKK